MLNKEILFCGDTHFNNKVNLPILNTRFILNLESPITDYKVPVNNKVNLKISKKSFIDTFSDQKPYAVNLSNNHIFDFGLKGFKDTLDTLDSLDIKYFGITTSKENIPLIIENKVAVLSYCCKATNPILNIEKYFIHDINLNAIKNDIDKYRKKIEYIILQFHWGEEEVLFPRPIDVNIARKCIGFGADLIIGHHAHVIQPSEIYNNKKIFYGVGNFIFDDLDVPSYFDGLKYKRVYRKKQFKSNRISIAVRLQKDFRIESDSYIYDTKLNKINQFNRGIIFLNFVVINDFLYKILKFLSMRIRMIKIFASNPQKISFKRIKLFLGA